MKNSVFLMILLSSVAFGYNPNAQKIEMGVGRVVGARNLKLVSLSLSVKTRSSEFPTVVNRRKDGGCSHKQTLLTYSGYEMATRLHVRTYEIQISNNTDLEKECQFNIFTEKNMTLAQSAGVIILF